MGSAAYSVFSSTDPLSSTPDNLYIFVLGMTVLLLLLVTLVVRQIIKIRVAMDQGISATRLHRRIVTLFSVVAITPTIIVAIFSVMFFEFGIRAWFSDKVQTVLDSTESVAETYILEHYNIIRADALGMANELDRRSFALVQEPALFEQVLNIQADALGLSDAIILNREGVITARATSTFSVFDGRINKQFIEEAAEGGVKIFSRNENDGQIRAIVKLDAFIDQYLYISRLIDAQALALVKRADDAKNDFETSQSQLSEYRLFFNLTFLVLALLVLFLSVWLGFRFAGNLMKPIRVLVGATDKVGKGDFTARAPIKEGFDDLGGLTKAFNTMTWQLQKQQEELLSANVKLDERRRFTETVLSGVSPGIMGLDAEGVITLPNRSATAMLAMNEEELKDKNIAEVMPEVADLFEKILKSKQKGVEDQIVLTRDDVSLNLLVRITAELKGKHAKGFVISFDDITEQVAAQRTAAWADVARRIAHEIKNPLTPIQLSAERLKRKYLKEVTSDPEIFTQCTDTIVRQVRDLRQMVDEFSSFARMPSPVMHNENLVDIAKQATFMMDLGSNNIEITTDFPSVPVKLDCDARQIGQALTNIIKNASEAIIDQDKGEINVSLTENDSEVIIKVSDNGKGMPEGMIDRLTEPYVTTRTKGTGLGLAIVKKIMKDHGGDLILENNPGAGASSVLIFNKAVEVNAIDNDEDNVEPDNNTRAEEEVRVAHGA
ncbi:sensor histidine kinase NtrY-like [Pseudemcibacter aquimaris]|uniref:sensor histidine kinase NtrY-like n=1 Tax=Pseudemcibacter aquimaris TaxID=2857064 RepID=UPI0020132D7B|nr:PAS domain-containing sensor histidine kinase [Pseudemcibacter aquimaris]WDU59750.1 PAS domain-containing sensor histidine kinase [Pseudemcibacter aquimaris]